MSLRVISGSAKGRRLKSVPGDTTRPVTDRVKEALFNILADDVVASTWWDLFAGTGAIGIEALSRGAAHVHFSDLNRKPIEIIRWNLEHCRLADRASIERGDALNLLAAPATRQFDYLYIAPPQYQDLWIKALDQLDGNPNWLAEYAWVIVQIDPLEYRELQPQHLTEFETRKYGSSMLVFYEKNG